MTVAVCVKCGSMKHGAWVPCGQCRFEPGTSTEKAQAILLSDHHMSVDDLTKASTSIKAGVPTVFDPETLQEIVGGIEQVGHASPAGFVLGLAVILLTLVVGVVLAITLMVRSCR